MLIADVNVDKNRYEEQSFMAELSDLMYRYGVHRVNAHWGVPEPCSRCGESPHNEIDNEHITVLDDDDPRLKDDVEKDEALDMLGKCVDRMPSGEIEISARGEDEDG